MTKEKRIEIARKLLQDAKDIQRYSRGEITKQDLADKGIKLALPI